MNIVHKFSDWRKPEKSKCLHLTDQGRPIMLNSALRFTDPNLPVLYHHFIKAAENEVNKKASEIEVKMKAEKEAEGN